MRRWTVYSVGFMCAVFLSPAEGIVRNAKVRCPNERFRQKISCRPGQALAQLTWTEDIPNCRKIHVECQNATISCSEECAWSPSCGGGGGGAIEVEYIRGVDMFYDMMSEKQTALFLCCRSADVKTAVLDCSLTKFERPLDGKFKPQTTSIMTRMGRSGNAGGLPSKVTYCPITDVHTPTCPLDKIVTDMFDDVAFGVASSPPGLEGLAGLAGLAGIALLNVTTCEPQLFANTDINATPWDPLPTTGLQDCINQCISDSTCLHVVYDNSVTCYMHYGPSQTVLTTMTWSTWVKCFDDSIIQPISGTLG